MRFLHHAVRTAGETLITLGLVLLLFLVWQLWWTDLAAGRTQDRTASRLQQDWDRAPVPTGSPTSPDTGLGPAGGERVPAGSGVPFAVLHVPRFGAHYARPVLQGVSLDVLDEGVGHYPGTAGPGAVGNFAVAGHRVTYAKPFNRIAELRPGDPVVVETARYWYVYRVVDHTIVTPDRIDVIAPTPGHPSDRPTRRMLTMTACHPQYSARQRYVVFAELDQRLAKTRGVVPDVLTT